jgi:hypothetical protein
MKKLLAIALLTGLAFVPARAQLFYNDAFNYPDGCIETNSGGLWTAHSGTSKDSLVSNGRLQVFGGGATTLKFDDVSRKFTNDVGATGLSASFTVNCSGLPTASGAYFAHFKDNTSSNFFGRIFALTGTNLCLPGAYRIGVAAQGQNGLANQVFPMDLATNTDYQVVISYDMASQYAALWVNAASISDTTLFTTDVVTNQQPLSAFAFRQNVGEGLLTVDNVAVGVNFSDVATGSPDIPIIAVQPQSYTNYVGNPATLYVLASGLGDLTYQWQHNGANISNPAGDTNVFTIPSLSAGDDGPYSVQISNSAGPTNSATAYLSVNTNAVAPIISVQPASQTNFIGQNVTLSVVAGGPGPLSYKWNFNGGPLNGQNSPTLTLTDVTQTNGLTGVYECDVINGNGTTPSSNAVVAVVAPPVESIGYLRALVDPVFFLPTNTTTLWTATGIVTTYTNVTTSGNAQFFMQDGTGGIAVFVGGSTTIRPQAGDSVTVTGPLGQFNSLLEMSLSSSDPSNGVITNSHGNPLPPGAVLPFGFTNSTAFGGVSNAIRQYEGAVVTFTNVYFPQAVAAAATNGTVLFPAGGVNVTITNNQGSTFVFRVDSRIGNIIGKPMPPFAWSVTGPMSFFLGSTVANRSGGYELQPTRYADIVTTPPAAATETIIQAGGESTVSWTAQPYLSYSVLAATNVSGPYLPLATGLAFNTTAGQFTDTNAPSGSRFYKIASP